MMRWDSAAGDPVTVNVNDRTALLAQMSAHLKAGEGFSLATINLDHVVKLARDPDFLTAYRQQTLVSADGNPIVWLAHLAGQKDVALVPGSEMIEPVAQLARDHGAPIGMFGSIETSLQAAADELQRRYPGLEAPMVRAPGMGFDPEGPEADAAIDAIKQTGARVIYLALGAPKQERFAAYAQSRLPGVGFLSIGAGLDFISGKQTRAPKLVQKLALEWLWRMLSNPKRLFGRYAACALAMPGLTLRALKARRAA